MRTLCLLLILANVLFFVWSQLIDVQVGSLERAPVNATPPAAPIVLASEAAAARESEMPAETSNDIQPPAVEPATPPGAEESAELARADALSCTSVGPFANLPQASQAQAALRAGGFEPRQRVEQGEIWIGYWVSVQGLATRAEAEAALRALSSNGIRDVYLMPGTDPANVVSVGVFSDYQRAQRRADQARALGLTPRIDDHTRSGPVYWIDVDLQEPGQIIDSSLFQTGPGKITRLEMRACPSSANG